MASYLRPQARMRLLQLARVCERLTTAHTSTAAMSGSCPMASAASPPRLGGPRPEFSAFSAARRSVIEPPRPARPPPSAPASSLRATCRRQGDAMRVCLVAHGIAWSCRTAHGAAWHCMAAHGGIWRCMALDGRAWRCMVTHGIAWSRMAAHVLACHCMVLHGRAWRRTAWHGMFAHGGARDCMLAHGGAWWRLLPHPYCIHTCEQRLSSKALLVFKFLWMCLWHYHIPPRSHLTMHPGQQPCTNAAVHGMMCSSTVRTVTASPDNMQYVHNICT
eukprot:365447-Chlamydomonas_euryale.AAC.21